MFLGNYTFGTSSSSTGSMVFGGNSAVSAYSGYLNSLTDQSYVPVELAASSYLYLGQNATAAGASTLALGNGANLTVDSSAYMSCYQTWSTLNTNLITQASGVSSVPDWYIEGSVSCYDMASSGNLLSATIGVPTYLDSGLLSLGGSPGSYYQSTWNFTGSDGNSNSFTINTGGRLLLSNAETMTCTKNFYQDGGSIWDSDNAANYIGCKAGYSISLASGSLNYNSTAGYGGNLSFLGNTTMGAGSYTANLRINNASGGPGNEDVITMGTGYTLTLDTGSTLDVTATAGTIAASQSWTLINCRSKNISGTFGTVDPLPAGSLNSYSGTQQLILSD